MGVPPMDTVDGVYWYIITLIVVLALLSAGYLVGMSAGLFPDFAQIY